MGELFPKKWINNEIKNELDEIKKLEEKIKRKNLIYMEIIINIIFNNMKL